MVLMRRGPGLIGASARTAVVVGTAGRVRRRQEQRFAAQDVASQQAAPAQAGQAAPPEQDYVAEIERLAQLNAQGLLTDEEFEAKKKQILGI